jgi:archaeosine-15-forming tRNA-guanine transglycosylase
MKRIYVVEIPGREEQYLVEASTQAEAVRAIVDKEKIAAHVATQSELIALTKKGAEVISHAR